MKNIEHADNKGEVLKDMLNKVTDVIEKRAAGFVFVIHQTASEHENHHDTSVYVQAIAYRLDNPVILGHIEIAKQHIVESYLKNDLEEI